MTAAGTAALPLRRKHSTVYRPDCGLPAQWSGAYPALVFAVIFVFVFLLHLPLLRLPYFWDEAGYYVPAARDLLLTGSLIPHTTVSNAHPPLVMAWLALWWKVVGYAPLVTRTAMLVLAAFSLLGLFRLAERVANTKVAVASTLCTALYPVFFAQSSLAQIDLAAAGIDLLGAFGLCRRSIQSQPHSGSLWRPWRKKPRFSLRLRWRHGRSLVAGTQEQTANAVAERR